MESTKTTSILILKNYPNLLNLQKSISRDQQNKTKSGIVKQTKLGIHTSKTNKASTKPAQIREHKILKHGIKNRKMTKQMNDKLLL